MGAARAALSSERLWADRRNPEPTNPIRKADRQATGLCLGSRLNKHPKLRHFECAISPG